MTNNDNGLMTFGGHLEVLRKMLFRIIGVALVFAIVIFCANFLLHPMSLWNFIVL